MPTIFINCLQSGVNFFEVSQKDVSSFYTYLSLIARCKIFHFCNVCQLNCIASDRRPHVIGGAVTIHCQCDWCYTFGLAIAFYNLQSSVINLLVQDQISNFERTLTTQPKAHRININTLPASGADPTIISLSLPPIFSWTFRKTSLSQIVFFWIIPLQQTSKGHASSR